MAARFLVPSLGADFGAFYVAGQIFNTYQPNQIYDTRLHRQLYQEQFPYTPPDAQLPYVNAPFFILPFTILARLPYSGPICSGSCYRSLFTLPASR